MHKRDDLVRDVLARTIMTVVDRTVKDHWDRVTQEPQLSSKVAHDLERLSGIEIGPFRLSVVAQDLPDRGKGSLDSRIGADMYVALKVEGRDSFVQKGLLIQSKWDKPMKPGQLKELDKQCGEMIRRSNKGSFVWTYGPSGTKVIPASEIRSDPKAQPNELSSRNIEELFINVMDCTSGDPRIAPDSIFEGSAHIGSFLEELSIPVGVAITATEYERPRLRGRR